MPSSSTTSPSSYSRRSTESSSSFSLHFPSPSSSSTSDRPSPHHFFATPGKSPHRNHPSIPSLLHSIESFQRTCTIDTPDATFHVAPPAIHALYRELQHPRILSGHTADTLRFTYDASTSTLTLRCMISPVHESIRQLATYVVQEMVFDAFLSRHEARHLRINSNASVALPGGFIKQPDAAFQFLDPSARLEPFPRVVFEMAFAQTYESVLEYARLWLVRSAGAVKLVVVVKLFEGPVQHPDDDDDADAPASPVSSAFSSVSAFSDFLNTADPAQWVGPITGFMELYRYDPLARSIVQDGPRYELYPVGQQADPRIGIADLLPLSHVVGDAGRSYPLSLAELRRLVEGSVRGLALLRRAERSRRASAEQGGAYADV